MFDDININSLDGIKKIIAQKCDQNDDGILQATQKKTTVDSIAFGYTNVKASAPTWSKNVNSYINQATKYYEPPK